MAGHPVEQRAAELNRILLKNGKRLGKAWRVRIRRILAETFSALGAPKLDGTRCQALEDQIIREISWLKDPTSMREADLVAAYESTLALLDGMSKPSFGNIPGNIDKEKQHFVDASVEETSTSKESTPLPDAVIATSEPVAEEFTMPEALTATEVTPPKTKKKKSKKASLRDLLMSDDYGLSTAQSPTPDVSVLESESNDNAFPSSSDAPPPPVEEPDVPKYYTKETPPEIGYFDIVNIQVRQAIIINAAVKPVRIGHAGDIADLYAETVNDRVERFIEVLSKPDSSIQFNSELTPGYEDDLIENMPDRGLVLHPKKKKKSSSLF